MEYIWNSEQIEKLLRHPSSEVRSWTIDKALKLYPDKLGDRILSLISSPDNDTVRPILNLIIEVNLPISNMEPLLTLAKDETRSECSLLAGAILMHSGCELLPDEIAFKSAAALPGLAAIEKKGFDLMLRFYSGPDSEKAPVMMGIAQACSFSDLLGEVVEARNSKSLNKRLNFLRHLMKCDIPHLEHFHRPDEILAAMDDALALNIPKGQAAWKQGLLNELETDRIKLGKVREIAATSTFSWSSEDKKFLLAAIICLRRNEACGRSLVEASDTAGLWKAVTLKPWRDAPGQELKEFLLSARPDELLNSLSQSLRQEYTYGSYSFSLLNALDTPGRLEFFLDIFEGNKLGDILAEEAGTALRENGLPAVEFIIKNYPRLSPELRVLGLTILDSFPVQQVVDFGLQHFDEYMLSAFPDDFFEFLERVGSRQFLEPLLREWKEGEVEMGRTIKLISEINGVRNEHINRIIQDFEKMKRLPDEALDTPITLYPLRCTQCGHTYNYDLNSIYIDQQKNFIIGDIIQCKGCGGLETYETTSQTDWKVLAELARVAIAVKEHPEKDVDSLETPLIVSKKIQLVSGQSTNNGCEAYHILKDGVEKHPQDAVVHRRMGNFLKNGGRDDLAIRYFQEAVRLHPLEVESLCNIVDIMVKQERYQEAIPYLDMVVPAIKENRMNEEMRRQMFGVFIGQAHFIEQKTGHKVELFPMTKQEEIKQAGESVWAKLADPDLYTIEDIELLYQMIRYGKAPDKATEAKLLLEATNSDKETRQIPVVSENKVGRNDPCPCGSGKKYKKCCGR